MKKALKSLLRNCKPLRRLIAKLYALTGGDPTDRPATNIRITDSEKDLYNENALYAGSITDYVKFQFATRKELEQDLKRIFYNNTGYYLDLKHPKTFNQKLQWLKLNYYDPALGRCVDKCEFKTYVAEQIGEGYTLPMYGCWDDESDIDFDALPEKFVLKSNVQSDGRHIMVIKDKAELNQDKLRTVLSSWLLKRNTLCASFCGAYKEVEPKILAEEYLEAFDNKALTDYKFMCFNGKAEMLFVVADRKDKMCVNFYDLDWNLLPFTRKYPNTVYPLPKPKNFDLMVELANKLAAPFPFVRVDFYESADGNNVYVGELTFYPGGGYETFQPMEWDYKLGEMLTLPEANC